MATDIDDNLGNWSDLVSIEAFQAIAENLNYLIDSVPVGQIVPILVGLAGVPTPDPTIWRECNGAIIDEELSDMRDQTAPDMRDRYLKGCATTSTSGIAGGSHTVNFAHAHGGLTDEVGVDSNTADEAEFGSRYHSSVNHRHGINFDLTVTNIEPSFICVKHYVKIR